MRAGKPYVKGPIWIVPMYGRDQVVEFARKLKVKGYSARRP
jgi:hypothetical protein